MRVPLGRQQSFARTDFNIFEPCAYYPPHLSAAQSKERLSATMRRRRRAGRPRAPSRAPQTKVEEHSGRASGANDYAVLRLRKTSRRAPSFALLKQMQLSAFAGEVGARGRAARPTNAGGNCENLQGFAGSEWVAEGTNGFVPSIVPDG